MALENQQGAELERDFGTNCLQCERYRTVGEVCVLEHGKRFLWEFCRDFEAKVELPDYNELMRSVKQEQKLQRQKEREKKEKEKKHKVKEREARKEQKRRQRIARSRRKYFANLKKKKAAAEKRKRQRERKKKQTERELAAGGKQTLGRISDEVSPSSTEIHFRPNVQSESSKVRRCRRAKESKLPIRTEEAIPKNVTKKKKDGPERRVKKRAKKNQALIEETTVDPEIESKETDAAVERAPRKKRTDGTDNFSSSGTVPSGVTQIDGSNQQEVQQKS